MYYNDTLTLWDVCKGQTVGSNFWWSGFPRTLSVRAQNQHRGYLRLLHKES